MLSASENMATILVDTFESDPYLLFSTTSLTALGNPVASFIGAVGTNQTVITVTNGNTQPASFYRAVQNF